MIERHAKHRVLVSLEEAPAVALLGPRQVGKTTLARDIAAAVPDSLYLDLENPGDAVRLADPARYLDAQAHRLVVLDEIQRMPGLFDVLRGQIDARRREGRRNAHFLLLGSASDALMKQTSESLAGRIIYDELPGSHRGQAGRRAAHRQGFRVGGGGCRRQRTICRPLRRRYVSLERERARDPTRRVDGTLAAELNWRDLRRCERDRRGGRR